MSNFDNGDTSTDAGAGGGGAAGAGCAEEYNSKGLMFQRLSLRDSQQVNNTNHASCSSSASALQQQEP